MRENNKHHSAFMSCLQWLWALGLWMCRVPSMWTPLSDLSAFSISAPFPFFPPPIAVCDSCVLGDTMKRPANFSSFDYKQSNFSWAEWLLLWTWLSHSQFPTAMYLFTFLQKRGHWGTKRTRSNIYSSCPSLDPPPPCPACWASLCSRSQGPEMALQRSWLRAGCGNSLLGWPCCHQPRLGTSGSSL